MKVKYIRKSNVSLTENKIYDVLSVEKGCYRIIDDTSEDYLFSPEHFAIIDDNTEQKTIHEKWEDSEITILPPKEKLTKAQIKEKLRDPNLPNEEKNELVEKLYEGIEIEEKQ